MSRPRRGTIAEALKIREEARRAETAPPILNWLRNTVGLRPTMEDRTATLRSRVGRGSPFWMAGLIAAFVLALPARADSGPLVPASSPAADTAQVTIQTNPGAATLTLRPVATLGDQVGSGILSDDAQVSMGPSGRFYVADRVTAPGHLLVYDSSGAFLTHIGREGEGPGEYLFPRPPWFSGEEMHVFDPLSSRWTVLTLDGEVRETRRLRIDPISATSVELVGGGEYLVVAGVSHVPDRIGQPFHLVDPSGTIVRSFGSHTGAFTPEMLQEFSRRMAPITDSTFLAAHTSRYEIELWTVQGDRLMSYCRQEDPGAWVDRGGGPPWETPPSRSIHDIAVDDRSRVWVMIRDRAADWAPRECPRYGDDGRCRFYRDEIDEFYRTTVEVLDLREARVVARAEFPGRLIGFLAPGLTYSYRATDGTYEVARLSEGRER